ncbi:UNVERIFIED_CONTAM: hypothetical protein PYX00_011353 [Menopon gallinae]|uniref:Diphthine methyl ester synthase n=1 Tax=Menopon gallinae TaxID=328185 RepID=A0AAW2H7A3_9NEOP
MLYLIGTGLSAKDVSVGSLERVRACDRVYLENYTSRIAEGPEGLRSLYGVHIEPAPRSLLECTEAIIEEGGALRRCAACGGIASICDDAHRSPDEGEAARSACAHCTQCIDSQRGGVLRAVLVLVWQNCLCPVFRTALEADKLLREHRKEHRGRAAHPLSAGHTRGRRDGEVHDCEHCAAPDRGVRGGGGHGGGGRRDRSFYCVSFWVSHREDTLWKNSGSERQGLWRAPALPHHPRKNGRH